MQALTRGSKLAAWILLTAIGLTLAGCAQLKPRVAAQASADLWTGRLSLQIQTDPPQNVYAGFELRGNPVQGELHLNTPLGNTVVAAHWSPGQASLRSGGKTSSFRSIDELLAGATGAALPASALFDWLAGKNTASNGWVADLTQQAAGRISARRSEPAPLTELRIVLDQ